MEIFVHKSNLPDSLFFEVLLGYSFCPISFSRFWIVVSVLAANLYLLKNSENSQFKMKEMNSQSVLEKGLDVKFSPQNSCHRQAFYLCYGMYPFGKAPNCNWDSVRDEVPNMAILSRFENLFEVMNEGKQK